MSRRRSARVQARERVARARRQLEAAEEDLRVAVQEAAAAGVTWREIGDLFDVSRQAAHKRFGPTGLDG